METSLHNLWRESRRRFRIWFLVFLTTAGLLGFMDNASNGGAEEGKHLVLHLDEVIRRTIQKSPDIAAVLSEIAGAKSDLKQVEAAYYPQGESNTLVGPVKNAVQPAIEGRRITDPSPDFSIGVFGRTDLTMTQPLYTFGKLSNRRESAVRGLAAKEQTLVQRENETALRVKELYYALVLAKMGVEAARDALSYFDEARARMKRLLEMGSSNVLESDLYRIDVYAADTLRAKAEAQKGVDLAYFALRSLMQLPPGTEFEPADKTLSVREEDLGEGDSYIRKALANRPEFKQLNEAVAAQKASAEAARSDLYPSFFSALSGSLAGAPGRETFHNAYIPDQFNHAYIGIVGGLNWHFDFGILRARVEKERAQLDKLLHIRASAKLNIPVEVVKYYREVVQWKVAVEAYDKGATAARKWIVAAISNFDMGVGTADDMLRSMEKYGQNRGKYLEALFTYSMSLAWLEYATGVRSW